MRSGLIINLRSSPAAIPFQSRNLPGLILNRGRWPNLIKWFWNQIPRYTFGHFLGTNARLPLDACRIDNCAEKCRVR